MALKSLGCLLALTACIQPQPARQHVYRCYQFTRRVQVVPQPIVVDPMVASAGTDRGAGTGEDAGGVAAIGCS